MRILGHGIDLVELARFEQRLRIYGDEDVLSTLFTRVELEYAGEGPHRIQRLAGIFAAKEAILKALGTGWVDGIGWTDVEVGSSDTGAPLVMLHSDIALLSSDRGISQWMVSISNSDTFAIASVIASGE